MGSAQPIRVASGTGAAAQMVRGEVVERLDQMGAFKVSLQHFAGRQSAILKLVDTPVTLGIVVHGVDDNLPSERLGGKLVKQVKENRYNHVLMKTVLRLLGV